MRQAIRAAFAALQATVEEGGSATFRDVAANAQVGVQAAHHTVANMHRAGELLRVGRHKLPGERVWTSMYALATVPPPPPPPSMGTSEAVMSLSLAIVSMLHGAAARRAREVE